MVSIAERTSSRVFGDGQVEIRIWRGKIAATKSKNQIKGGRD